MAKSGVLSQTMTHTMHVTTHIDAPAHVVPGTPFIDEVPLPHFFGSGLVVSIPKKKWEKITGDDLEKACGHAIRKGDVLIINTGWHKQYEDGDYFAYCPGLVQSAADWMVEKGVKVQTGLNVASMSKGNGGIVVTDTNGDTTTFDHVMYATGRHPNTQGLGLELLGIELDKAGAVKVDAYSKTGVDSIYAIGDVTNRVNLTPVAIREGMAFVETVFKGNPTPVDHELIPSAVFTQPEFGTIGLTEAEAAAKEPIEVYATSFKPMNHAFAGREDRVMMKLIVSKATRVVLGCHIVADHAGEMIQLAGIAVKLGATKEQFDQTVAVHPTMAEELVTMKEPTRTT